MIVRGKQNIRGHYFHSTLYDTEIKIACKACYSWTLQVKKKEKKKRRNFRTKLDFSERHLKTKYRQTMLQKNKIKNKEKIKREMYSDECDETLGNNSTQALSTKNELSSSGVKRETDNKRRRKQRRGQTKRS